MNVSNEVGDTALLLTMEAGEWSCVKAVLRKGANVNVCNRSNMSPVVLAANVGEFKCLSIITERINRQTLKAHGGKALIEAVMRGFDSCVRLLLEKGVDVNSVDNEQTTELMFAANNGHVETMRVLTKHKDVHLDMTDRSGATALELTTRYGHWNCIQELFKRRS